MNEKIINIYDDLCKEYGSSAEDAKAIVEKAISELSLSERIRPDAKLFLMVNVNQLILIPYRKVSPEFGSVGMLVDDIRVILKCARGIAQDRGRERIIARDVVEATGITWRSVLMHIDPVPEA